MKNTTLSLVIAMQTSFCLASSKDENSLFQTTASPHSSSHVSVRQFMPPVSIPPLIEGTFPEQRLTLIQNMFNNAVKTQKFDMIIPQLGLLEEFGDRINRPTVLVNLFKAINTTHGHEDEAYKLMLNVITTIKAIPQDITKLTREYLFQFATGTLIPRYINPSDTTISFFETVLKDSLDGIEYFYMGRICARNKNAHQKSIQFLETYAQQCVSTECSDEKMLAAITLYGLQGMNIKTDYFEKLNISPLALINWMRTKFTRFDESEEHLAYHAYNYVIENHKSLCRAEDYLKRDYFFWVTNDNKHCSLILHNKEVINIILETFKDNPVSALEESYIDLSRTYSKDKETQKLGLYALLCLKEYKQANSVNVLHALFQIHEYHSKYLEQRCSSDSDTEEEKENLFQAALMAYNNQHSLNTGEDSFRLGRMAYKIFKRKELWNITAIASDIKVDGNLKKYCLHANQYLVKASQQSLSHTLSAQVYYYLSLTKSQLGQLEEANESMENARFWNEGEQDKKIRKLKSKAAQGAFAKNDHGEAIKHLRDIEASGGKLSGNDIIIKLICSEKLGYTYNIQQELEGFKPDLDQQEYIVTLFRSKMKEEDDDAVCVLFHVMKSIGWRIEETRIRGYIEAELRRHNFTIVCEEVEKFLQNSERPANDFTRIPLYHALIVGLAKTNQKEKFLHYMKEYIDQLEKPVSNPTDETQKKKRQFVSSVTVLFIREVIDNDLTSDYLFDMAKMLNSTALSFHPASRIYLASILSASNLHKEAVECLFKGVTIDETKGIKFTCDVELEENDFTRAHTYFKSFYPYICNSLISLNMEPSVKAVMRYLKSKHNIVLKEPKKKSKNSKKSNTIEMGSVYNHLISSYSRQANDDHQSVVSLIKEFSAIGETDGQYVKSLDVPVIIQQATEHCALIQKQLEVIKSISSGNKPTPDQIEKSRQAREEVTLLTNVIKGLVKGPLHLLEQERKKRLNREKIQTKYGLHQEDFLDTSSNTAKVSRQVALRLQELHQKQKDALILAKQKIRQAQRKQRQEAYKEAHEEDHDDNTVIAPETTLISCDVLPTTEDAYLDHHSALAWKILSHKFKLNPYDQETLRVILTGGERSFQITLKDIKSLFAKFEGYTSNVHHGGSHEQVAGMGLTLMPNADGVKKGSYKGQLKQAREKVISIIAKGLTYKDLNDAS